jgi:hypothetical protein
MDRAEWEDSGGWLVSPSVPQEGEVATWRKSLDLGRWVGAENGKVRKTGDEGSSSAGNQKHRPGVHRRSSFDTAKS